jgi:hypothetical protein
LLASFDAGRPIEIDPERLAYITAVGSSREWKVSLPGAVQPGIMTSAHPFYDPFESRVYTVNERSTPRNGTSLTWNEVDLWLARWDGEGRLERWHVNGTDFSQYVHEVTATNSFVAWADSGAFIMEPGQRYGLPRTHPQLPHTDLAIVRKADLAKSATEVTAKVVRIPLEGAHIFADYDDDGEHITLYLAHANSVELTTSVKPGDINFFTNAPVEPSAIGAFTVADAVPFAKYRIHVDTGQVVESARVVEPHTLWGLALYARDYRPDAIRTNRDVFLTYLGYDPKIITSTMIDLYGNHPHRIVPTADLPRKPLPSYLTRVDLATMTTVDRYAFPSGWVGTSPTWIPATGGDRAYLLVHVFGEANTQVWLFDTENLAQGPIAKLGHPEFRLPFTLHTAWLPALSPRVSHYRVDFAEEIGQDYRLLPDLIRNTVDQVLAFSHAERLPAHGG